MWLKLSLIFTLVLITSAFSKAPEEEKPLPRFTEVDTDLYRGGQPTEEGLDQLKEMGIDTVISMRTEKDLTRWEKAEVESRGMNYVHIPWTIYGKKDEKIAQSFFGTIDAAQGRNEKIFYHCKRGVERTGVMSALYLMRKEGVSREEAFERVVEPYPLKLRWILFVKSKLKFFAKHL